MEEKKKKGNGCLIVAMLFTGMVLWMFVCGGIGIILGLIASGTSVTNYQENLLSEGGEKKVVVIDVKGEITSQNGVASLFSSEMASAPIINSQIQAAMDDPDVVGIVLDMNTPGGDVVASDMIYQKVNEAKAAGLTVVTSMETLAASGGYYVAAASDKILANEMTITGSIGVYSVYQDVSGLYEKVGIDQRVIKSGDYKTGEGLFDEDDNGAEDQIYIDLIESAHDQFKTIVSTERGIPLTQMESIADGRIFSGKQGVANGLIDMIGNLEDAVKQVETLTGEGDLTIIRYYDTDFLGKFLSVFKKTSLESMLYNLAKAEQGAKIMYKMQ